MTDPSPSSRHDIVSFGEFTLDRRSGSFAGPRGKLTLRPKSHQLLCYLIDHPNELITKRELVARLWPDVRVTDDSLVKCMRDVRLALGDDAKSILQTVPRRGYRLIVEDVRATAPPLPRRDIKRLISAIAVGVVALLAIGGMVLHARHAGRFRSIAVLPFTTLTGNVRDPVLEIGIADMLITRLSNDRRVTVRPISSVQRFADTADPVSAGRVLGVDAVLEGHLQRAGDRLRVSVNLLRTSDGRPLWGDTFDEPLTGIMRIEEAVSDQVADALMLQLRPHTNASMRSTVNVAAYSDYMRGRYYFDQRTEQSVMRSIGFFEAAIAREPAYAQAHAALAEAHIFQGVFFTAAPNEEPFTTAREAALAALEIDDSLTSAHTSLGFIHLWLEWNFPAAEREFQRALDLNPNDADAHQQYGQLLIAERRYSEAIAHCTRAVEIDPAYVLRPTMLSYALFMSRRYDEALARARDALELQPDFWMAHNVARNALLQLGNVDGAFAQTMSLHQDLHDDAARLRALQTAWATLGFTGVREEELKSARGTQRVRILAELGRRDEALQALEEALAEHDGSLIYLLADPRYDTIRDDPRFKSVVRQVGIP